MIKKNLRIGLMLLVMSICRAFGDASTSQGQMLSAYDAANTGTYVQAELGGANSNWSGNFPDVNFYHRGQNGFIWGGDIGYQWSRFLAAEVGTLQLQPIRFILNNTVFYARTWTVDGAAKLMVPLPHWPCIVPFLKAGVAYRDSKLGGGFSRIFGDFVPLATLGLQYNATVNFYLYGQWSYLGAGSNVSINLTRANHLPSYNIYMFGAGYKFTFF